MTSHKTPPPATRLRDLPSSFWWLWSAELVIWIGRFVVPFMTIFLTTSAGFSAAQAGLVVAGYGLGVVVSSLGGGVLADRIGRKTTLLWSLVLSAVILVVIPSASGAPLITGLLFVYGLFNGASQPAIITMVGDLVPQPHRRAAYNYSYWAVNLGYAIGPMLAGFLADQAFGLLFYGQAGMVLVAAVIVALRVPETRVVASADPAAGSTAGGEAAGVVPGRWSGGILGVLKDRVFISFGLAMFVYSIVYVQSTTTLPLVMTGQGFSTQQYGYLLTLNGLLLCVLQIPTARFLGRWSRQVILVIALCVTAVGLGVQAAAASMVLYLAAVTVWTLGEMGSHPTAQSIVADLAEQRRRGRYQGVYALHHSGATVVGPVLGGVVLDRLGSQALWLACGVLCLLVAGFMALTARSREARILELHELEPVLVTAPPGTASTPTRREDSFHD